MISDYFNAQSLTGFTALVAALCALPFVIKFVADERYSAKHIGIAVGSAVAVPVLTFVGMTVGVQGAKNEAILDNQISAAQYAVQLETSIIYSQSLQSEDYTPREKQVIDISGSEVFVNNFDGRDDLANALNAGETIEFESYDGKPVTMRIDGAENSMINVFLTHDGTELEPFKVKASDRIHYETEKHSWIDTYPTFGTYPNIGGEDTTEATR